MRYPLEIMMLSWNKLVIKYINWTDTCGSGDSKFIHISSVEDIIIQIYGFYWTVEDSGSTQ